MSLLHVEPHSAQYEHQFWLQILGDHSRFIHSTLYPVETIDIQASGQFIRLFDDLLAQSRSLLDASQLWTLNHAAYHATVHLRAFKLNLLDRSLLGAVKIGISPSFFNHMVNELDEYVRILQELLAGRPVPQYPPLHYDLVWLTDAAFHSATIAKNLDFAERQFIAKSNGFEQHFNEFYLKAIELAGYLRTMRKDYPVFAKFHQDINLEMGLFMNFLNELKELDLSNELLSSMTPLLPDHLFREECYYLNKLAQLGEIPMKDCSPTTPRVDR
ncbi:DUF2935 domain-containing protein [Paenibacillus aestuarii]|uniref:DUF2935 domain-containing protein n=1 Tax=Paenibacillus aestuarii TaxID=516965 RepID=A0ABW0KJG9_9BACL|nr:DUF2935 domain-containing protein [Paenibacillus aestuarii]